MPQTHNLGPLFVHGQRLRWNTPPAHRAPTWEMDPPFRVARSFILHLWPTTLGIVFGFWRHARAADEDEQTKSALEMRDSGEAAEWDERVDHRPWSNREFGDIVVRTINGELDVVSAPKFAIIDPKLAEQLPRWRPRAYYQTIKGTVVGNGIFSPVVKVGPKKYWLRGHGIHYGQFVIEAERIDRRNPWRFLFGGAQPWD